MSECPRCGKGNVDEVSYGTVYNKCRGKTCPDCGKVRKLSGYESFHEKKPLCEKRCIKCKQKTNHWIDKLCRKCFFEREKKRGCVCIFTKDYNEKEGHHNNINYYCPLCEEAHSREALCEKCFEKEQAKYWGKLYTKKQLFLQIVLPTVGISLIIGFFLGWLFLVKLRKKKTKK